MSILQKFIWFVVIFFVSYVLLIFNSPIISGAIEKALGIEGFNEFVLNFKGTYDTTVTSIPTRDDLNNAYNTVASGSIEFQKNLKLGVELTKDKIDGYRLSLSGAEGAYNDMVDGYNEVKDYVNTNSGVIDEIKDTIESFSGVTNTLSNTGNLDGITDTIGRIVEVKDDFLGTGTID